MQESRLFRIMYHLLAKGQATAPELAEKFEVSVRTIYRDIDALSGAGIPVYTETGRKGGIYLMQDFVLDKAVLSEEEKGEILAALQSVNVARNTGSSDILQKLSAVFSFQSKNWLEVDFSRWGNKGYDDEKFELLKSAVIYRKNVRIRYADTYETVSERVIQPLKLCFKAKAWYLKAFCTHRQDYRIFKLNRILSLEVLDQFFSDRIFPKQEEGGEEEYHQITLCFPKEMAYRVYDEFEEAQVKRRENGDLVVSAKMPEDAWLTGFLLSFGPQVEVLEPVHLKEILAEQARLIYEKNRVP